MAFVFILVALFIAIVLRVFEEVRKLRRGEFYKSLLNNGRPEKDDHYCNY